MKLTKCVLQRAEIATWDLWSAPLLGHWPHWCLPSSGPLTCCPVRSQHLFSVIAGRWRKASTCFPWCNKEVPQPPTKSHWLFAASRLDCSLPQFPESEMNKLTCQRQVGQKKKKRCQCKFMVVSMTLLCRFTELRLIIFWKQLRKDQILKVSHADFMLVRINWSHELVVRNHHIIKSENKLYRS